MTSCIERHVVLPVDALDHEAAVLALAGQAVLEHDHRGDHLGALEVGDVVALDAQRRVVEPERVLDLLEGLVAGGQVRGALGLVQDQGLAGVAADGLLEAACRRAAAPGAHPAPPEVAEQLPPSSRAPAAAAGTRISRGISSPSAPP